VNACEDWSVEDAGLLRSALKTAQLVNNRAMERLELWVQKGDAKQVRYDFYFNKDKLKAGGFKVLGAHNGIRIDADMDNDFEMMKLHAVESGTGSRSLVWMASSNRVYTLNQTISLEDMQIEYGRLDNRGDPAQRFSIFQHSLQHSMVGTGADVMAVYKTRNVNEPDVSTRKVAFLNRGDVGRHIGEVPRVSGTEVFIGLEFTGPDDQSWGPYAIEVEGLPDGR
jgi:hypothetical protein